MKDLLTLLLHLLTTIAKLLAPSGAKAVVADSLLMKQQLPRSLSRANQRLNRNSPHTGSTPLTRTLPKICTISEISLDTISE